MVRTGDHVHHGPTGEDWVVAYVDGDRIAWCGWPEGEAMLSDCALIKQATDEEHLTLLHTIAKADAGKRSRMAQRALDLILSTAEVQK